MDTPENKPKKKYLRKYKCVFCDKKLDRNAMVTHVASDHEDMIPEGYTARRVVFNYFNHKEYGTCVICGKRTEWIEEAGHYDRYCSNKCRKIARETYKDNMLRVRGTTNVAEDPNFQQRMLAGRRISGTYRFETDGAVRSYTGSYERQLLEFADKALHIPGEYINTPGPTLQYSYNGETHNWITDQYWYPWNLIIEVKDGGVNPNRRPMPETRTKTLCKEVMITDQGIYNYLRLTNNQFVQLIEILMEIKKENMAGNKNYTIKKVYESAPLTEMNHYINKHPLNDPNTQHGVYFDSRDLDYQEGGVRNPYALRPTRNDPRAQKGVFFISYSFKSYVDDESIEGFALATDLIPKKILTVRGNRLVVEDGSFLDDRQITIYRYLGDKTIKDILTTEAVDMDYLYTALTNKKMYILEQSFLDYENFAIIDPSIQLSLKESYNITLQHEFNVITNRDFSLPVTSVEERAKADLLTSGLSNITILEDINGYYVWNDVLKQRSISYPSVSDIPLSLAKIISTSNIRESVYYDFADVLLVNYT